MYTSFYHCYSSTNTDKNRQRVRRQNMAEAYIPHPLFHYDRDFKGYGEAGLQGLKWPNGAKIAVSFVINYEEVRTYIYIHLTLHSANLAFFIVGCREKCPKRRRTIRTLSNRTTHSSRQNQRAKLQHRIRIRIWFP